MANSKIKVYLSGVDGSYSARTFTTLKGASAFARRAAGDHPEMSRHYAISGDGVAKITVDGAKLSDLFPEESPVSAQILGRSMSDAEYEMYCDYEGPDFRKYLEILYAPKSPVTFSRSDIEEMSASDYPF